MIHRVHADPKKSHDYRMWGINVGLNVILSVEGCWCVEGGRLSVLVFSNTESLLFHR